MICVKDVEFHFIKEHTIYGRQLTKGNMKMVSINLASI